MFMGYPTTTFTRNNVWKVLSVSSKLQLDIPLSSENIVNGMISIYRQYSPDILLLV